MGTFRIIYLGTPDFAVAPLEALLAGPDQVVAVVTQPDRPSGRGRKLTPPPVKVVAEGAGLPVFQPRSLKGEAGDALLAELAALEPDLGVVAAYGRILPKRFLDLPRLGCLNVHASLLPRWRGASPIQWAIAAGDAETGVTIMQMDAGLDTGPMRHVRRLAIAPDETGGQLFERLAPLGAEALMEALDGLRAGDLPLTVQPEAGATYAPLLTRDDGRLDFTGDAVALARRIRAFQPWPGAFTTLGGRLLKVQGAEALPAGSPDAAPGTVIASGPAGIDVACGTGALRLTRVQPEGRRPMDAAAYLAGRPLAPGTRLGAA